MIHEIGVTPNIRVSLTQQQEFDLWNPGIRRCGAIGGLRRMAIPNLRVEPTFSGTIIFSQRQPVRKKSCRKEALEPDSSCGRDVV